MNDMEKINAFLGDVDLAKYREKYAPIKLVELDLPRHIQAIPHLYREYWERRARFPSFEKFYDAYAGDLQKNLEEFRREKMFSEETFYRGLPARIYRTWASLLTQIQGGYAAEKIYGRGNVEMGAALDYQGVDIRLTDGDEVVNLQIKKETMSREVRTPWQHIKRNIKIITVIYEVPGSRLFLKNGEPNTPFLRWREKWRGKLARLDNGFIVFLPEMFARDYLKMP